MLKMGQRCSIAIFGLNCIETTLSFKSEIKNTFEFPNWIDKLLEFQFCSIEPITNILKLD